jgi:hypothetical protein
VIVGGDRGVFDGHEVDELTDAGVGHEPGDQAGRSLIMV